MKKVLAATVISLVFTGFIAAAFYGGFLISSRQSPDSAALISKISVPNPNQDNTPRDSVEVGITLGSWSGQHCQLIEVLRVMSSPGKETMSDGNVQACIQKKIESFGYNYMSMDERRNFNNMK